MCIKGLQYDYLSVCAFCSFYSAFGQPSGGWRHNWHLGIWGNIFSWTILSRTFCHTSYNTSYTCQHQYYRFSFVLSSAVRDVCYSHGRFFPKARPKHAGMLRRLFDSFEHWAVSFSSSIIHYSLLAIFLDPIFDRSRIETIAPSWCLYKWYLPPVHPTTDSSRRITDQFAKFFYGQ